MGPFKRLTKGRQVPAAEMNGRSQAHPMPGGSSAPPSTDEPPTASGPRDAVLVEPVPDVPTMATAPSSDALATPGHAWTAEDRPYDRLDCPACGTVFKELPVVVADCPTCDATIHVLTCPEGVRHLLTVADHEAFDEDWDALHARRKREEAQRRNLAALRARRAMLDSYIELGVRLVELHNAPGACPACVAAAAHTYRPRAAPTLPIEGCAHDICRCQYAPARPSAAHR